ncbi:MAG: class I SAM-dependent methyltransferase [Gemmobacter sp.]|nr:class I SAM-dependent methyltransferase [Gemmobacter sp.]
MWDQRYSEPGYLFGTDPAVFVQREATQIAPGGRVLCVADGDGRNSVYLAGLGFDVVAMDPSAPALDKARALAALRGVTVDHLLASVESWDWTPEAYDAVVGVFIQFAPPALRTKIHAGIASTLRPGGKVLLHGYAPRQIAYATGGPRDITHLYTPDGLTADFPGWKVLVSADYDADLAEGARHVGRSALVDFVAQKP